MYGLIRICNDEENKKIFLDNLVTKVKSLKVGFENLNQIVLVINSMIISTMFKLYKVKW